MCLRFAMLPHKRMRSFCSSCVFLEQGFLQEHVSLDCFSKGAHLPLDDASKQAKVCLESPVFYHHWQMAATCAMIVLCTTVHIII